MLAALGMLQAAGGPQGTKGSYRHKISSRRFTLLPRRHTTQAKMNTHAISQSLSCPYTHRRTQHKTTTAVWAVGRTFEISYQKETNKMQITFLVKGRIGKAREVDGADFAQGMVLCG